MKHFLSGLLLFCIFPLSAQQPVWKRFTQLNGLPNTTITAFAQTTDGILWIGSQEGLIRYDGITFSYAGENDSKKPYVQGILVDQQQNLFLATRSGLWKYNTQTDKLIKLHHSGVDISIYNIVWNTDSSRLIASSDNGIRIYKPDDGLLLLEKTVMKDIHIGRVYSLNKQLFAAFGNRVVWLNTEFEPTREVALNKVVHDIEWYAPFQKFIAVTADGFLAYQTQTNRFEQVGPIIQPRGLPYSQCLFKDSKNRIWLNTSDTVFCFNDLHPNTQPAKSYWEKDNPTSPGATLICFFEDAKHHIWAGGGGSGISVNFQYLSSLRYTHSSAFGTSHIWSVYHDTIEGVVLYGTNNSIVISESGRTEVIHKPIPKQRFTVTCFTSFNDKHWLVGTYGGGLWLLHKKTHRLTPFMHNPYYSFNSFYCLQDGSLLMPGVGFLHHYKPDGTYQNSWGEIHTGNNISITQTDVNTYAIGTSNGIIYADGNGHILKKLVPEGVNPNAASDFPVMAVYTHQPTGDLYVATMNWGLCVVRKGSAKIETIQLLHEPGMVYGILPYKKNELLLSTGNGLYKYNTITRRSVVANSLNGLPFNEFEQLGYNYSRHQYTFIGAQGYITFPEEAVESLFSGTPDFSLFYNKKHVTTRLDLNDTLRSLNMVITPGIDAAVQSVKYTYCINELDHVYHTANGELQYNYIPPGNYTLTIKAMDVNHRFEPTVKTIAITVEPRWYETLWFKLLTIAAALAVLIYLVRYFSYLRLQWNLRKLEAQQKVAEERMRISRELHDNVGSQLTYLITGLETSEFLLKKQQTEKLSANLEQLQLSARDSIQQLRDAIWALNKEEMTIQLLAERFREWLIKMTENNSIDIRFNQHTEHSRQLDSIVTLNIFRILQEAVHNTIKHTQATQLDISIRTTSHECTFTVSDNGAGFLNKKEGNGVENMRARAEQIGAVLSLTSTPHQGTTVKLWYLLK